MAFGISAPLKTQVRDLLLNCPQFASDETLRAVFNDSRLVGWQNSLPEASNRAARVDKLINFLVDAGTAEENALALFLRVLGETPEMRHRQEIYFLAQELELSQLEPEIQNVLQSFARLEDKGPSAEWQLFGEKNAAQLRALFEQSELRCWSAQVFEAARKAGSSSAYRANAVFDFLKEKTHPTNGKNGVALLLEVLAQKTKSAYDRERLNRLAQKFAEVKAAAARSVEALPPAPLPDAPAPSPVPPAPPEASPQSPETYTDLEIHILGGVNGVYPVNAQLGSGDSFSGEFRLDAAARNALNVETDPEKYGEALSQILFTGAIRDAYLVAGKLAEVQTGGRLRLRLWIDNAAVELQSLKWELLRYRREGTSFRLATAAQRPFSRYFGLGQADPAPLTARPIRMLVMIANPRNLADYKLPSLDVEGEVRGLLDMLGDLPGVAPALTLLPGQTALSPALQQRLTGAGCRLEQGPASLDALIELLSHAPGYHIVHFLGHGAYDKRRKQAALYCEDRVGNTQSVTDKVFAEGLLDAGALPHLVFLAACESARREADSPNPFIGLAPRLIQIGVPAVVAMQDTIGISQARTVTHHFYRFLFKHGIVDTAINQARGALARTSPTDYAIPVLFTRLKAGGLFIPYTPSPASIGNSASPPAPAPQPVAESKVSNLSEESPPLAMAKRVLADLELRAAGYTALTIPSPLRIELEEKRKEVAALERGLPR